MSGEECCEKSENDEYWCPNCDMWLPKSEVYADEHGDVAGCTTCIGGDTAGDDKGGRAHDEAASGPSKRCSGESAAAGTDESAAASELEPAAWMELDDMGGAGLVPHLTEIRAERGTSENNKPEYPKPLFYLTSSESHPPATGILDLWDEAIEHLEAMKCGEECCEKCIGIDQALTAVRARRDKLADFTQNGGSGE